MNYEEELILQRQKKFLIKTGYYSVILLATFFMTIDFDKIIAFIKKHTSRKLQPILVECKGFFFETVLKCVRAYVLIMTISWIEIWLGLSIIGIPNAASIAFLIALFDILPVLGSGGVLIPWTIIAAMGGDYRVALGIGLLYIMITVIRNIIEPKLVGKQVGLHPLVALSSMLLGVHLFGFLGLLGLPITISLIKHLIDCGLLKLTYTHT